MAVYTQLEFDEIAALIAPLALGRLTRAQGIAAGVENTTYFLNIERGHHDIAQYVLTIAETLSRSDLEFIATLMHALDARGLPVPSPEYAGAAFAAHEAVLSIREKPALLVPRIAGTHPRFATPDLCHRLGSTLASLHLATLDIGGAHESHRSLNWVHATGSALLTHVDKDTRKLLSIELDALRLFLESSTALPQAIIHGDLFRDNVLVESGRITGLIDFFSAGTGYLMLDLAIAVNDWCFDDRGKLDSGNYRALIDGYCSSRAPESAETRRWGDLLRIAALRFWVSRLNERLRASLHAPAGRGKDPTPYQHLLLAHRNGPLTLKS